MCPCNIHATTPVSTEEGLPPGFDWICVLYQYQLFIFALPFFRRSTEKRYTVCSVHDTQAIDRHRAAEFHELAMCFRRQDRARTGGIQLAPGAVRFVAWSSMIVLDGRPETQF